MNSNFDTHSSNEGTLTLYIDPEDYQPLWTKNMTQYRRKVKTKGFRQGHAPMATVKELYGAQVLRDTIFEVAQEGMINYLKNYNVRMLGAPLLVEHTVDKISMKGLERCKVAYRIGFVPNFSLPKKGKLPVKSYTITTIAKDMLDEVIEGVRRSYATYANSPSVAPGTIVQGYFQEQDEKEKPYYIDLADKTQFVHASLLTKKVGDTITLSNQVLSLLDQINPLPEAVKKQVEKGDAEVAFTIKIIFLRKLPAIDKDFYTKVLGSPVETEEAFRKTLTENIIARDQQHATQMLKETLIENYISTIALDLPDEVLKIWLQTRQEQPLDAETVNKEYPSFDKALQWDLILEKLVTTHNIEVSPKEIEEKLISYLKARPSTDDEAAMAQRAQSLLKKNKDNLSHRIARLVREDKALEIIKAASTIEEVPITSRDFYDVMREKKEKQN